jgi:hypothetical protein
MEFCLRCIRNDFKDMLPQHPGIQGGGDVAGLQHFDIHAPVTGYL